VEVLNASAGAWAIDNELSYVRSRGIFQSDLVLLVLNDGDVTQPRSTMAEVGDGLPNKRPATAIGELFTRYIEPRALHMVGHNDAGDSVNTNADGIIRENLADLDQFKEAVTDQGARLIIVYVPFRRDIPDLSATSRSILQAWSTAHKIPMLDLTAAELPYTSNAITLGNGVHFNARGNLIVAEAIEKLWPQSVGK
jgi:hypothetical protein